MDSDAPPAVNLEVTVLHTLPAGLHRHEAMQAAATGQYSENNESEEMQQVQLVPIGLQQDPSPREHRSALADIPTRMIHSIRFRILHLTLPAPDRPFLLQILRRYNKYIGKKRRKRNLARGDNAGTGSLYVTSAMAFSVEFRSSCETVETNLGAPAPTSSSTLIPGMNRVVIFLDNEGTPAGYSIDGAES
jgi:hypothetical protein